MAISEEDGTRPRLSGVGPCSRRRRLRGATQAATANPKIKIWLLPIPESLPMWVADRDGYFAAEKVSVELVNFASAVEREATLQAGQLDGDLNDLVSLGLLNKE